MSAKVRNISRVITPQPTLEGAGVHLKRSIATHELNYLDPFLLFDHFGSDDPKDYLKGFPMHPHRGIETVTYMLAGEVHHKDSIGHEGDIYAGDVQWMTSGGGIMHEEMPKPVDGKMEGFQLWVNLPARLKMSRPFYQEFKADKIPEVFLDDGIRIRIVAGEASETFGPVTGIAAKPVYLDVFIPKKKSYIHKIEEGYTAFAYVFEGEGAFAPGSELIGNPHLIVFSDGNAVEITTRDKPVRFLLISGKPLGEPIARYGPFVMNTQEEIREALEDLRNGTFVWQSRQ